MSCCSEEKENNKIVMLEKTSQFKGVEREELTMFWGDHEMETLQDTLA